jgi:hypothetical protein
MPPAKRTAKGVPLGNVVESARKKKRPDDETERRLEAVDPQMYARFVLLQIRKSWKSVEPSERGTSESFWFCEPCRGPEGELLCAGSRGFDRGVSRAPRRCLGAEDLEAASRSTWAFREPGSSMLVRDFVLREHASRNSKK